MVRQKPPFALLSKPDRDLKLPARLQSIAGLVSWGRIADIGCDHGLLTAHLLMSGLVSYAVASDISPGPLKAAEETLRRYGLLELANLRLGGGLTVIAAGEVETCVIAGMGGMNIVNMLQDGRDIAKSLKQLVLSPERDAEALRRYLHVSGFYIANEVMTWENRHFYLAIDARPGNEEAYNAVGYMFGRRLLARKDAVLRRFLEIELAKTCRIIEGFNGRLPPDAIIKRHEAVQEALETYK